VLIGRSKDALPVLVPRIAFDDVGELAQHLRDPAIAKGTTVDISAEVAKGGGPGPTTRATLTPQRISAENPDRKSGNVRPCAIGSTSISALAVEYGAKSAIADAEEGVAEATSTNPKRKLRCGARSASRNRKRRRNRGDDDGD
jgi:hypothetical protein